jgi:hypothetical protein
MNADCVSPTSEQATIFYTNAANTPGVDYGDWFMICGGGGYYLSAIDLANFMANIRYNNTILSPANREIMKDNYIGWSELGTLNGKYGEYFNHGGSINSSDPTGSNLENMRGLIIQFPNKVELAVMAQDESPAFVYGLSSSSALRRSHFLQTIISVFAISALIPAASFPVWLNFALSSL